MAKPHVADHTSVPQGQGVNTLSPAPVSERVGGAERRVRLRLQDRLVPGAAPALALFASLRLAGVAAIALANHLAGRPLLKALTHSWDSRWYLHIAEHGYGTRVHVLATTGAVQRDWAFFPLYPGLIRIVSTVLPLTPGAAALLIAWCAAGVAAYGIYAIGHHLYGRAVATALVGLWAALPHSVVLDIAYTEPLFTALAAWSLYAVLRSRWLWAGALAGLAGLSRPTGFAVAAAIIAVAAHEVVRWRGRVPRGLWIGTAIAPLGWVGFVLWVGDSTGDPLGGYFRVQRAWDSRFDFGAGSLHFLRALLLHGGRVDYPLALVIVTAAVLLFCLLCMDRAPLGLIVYAGILVLITVGGSGPYASKPRFLLPAFPLLLPLAFGLARTWRVRPKHALLLGTALAAVSLVYGTYLLTTSRTPL
ncbi:hypothetical protein ACFOZ0_04210 [Streptomyces yaanensis]|uniref:Glycosyltransferase RgtA/B/C/D-like domain-containing protein n=1 Tax=Streptomyces yaanensis TaxID=1142239 RepID=A0ABV7S846_9ACTN|nr:hypothetical protein [Streptomyces sp. CGMCC 4.7035]WNC00067.1 hypothetical protein Q2K21_19430 [Streptomyces sp. CGMCC 4.7035]